MEAEIKLTELDEALADLSYPVARDRAASALDGTTLQLADGEVRLGQVIASSTVAEFESESDLTAEVRALLPRRAVGEPYQSEGEG